MQHILFQAVAAGFDAKDANTLHDLTTVAVVTLMLMTDSVIVVHAGVATQYMLMTDSLLIAAAHQTGNHNMLRSLRAWWLLLYGLTMQQLSCRASDQCHVC